MISKPHIKTALPGPNAKAIIERDTRSVSPSYTRGYPLVIARGAGAMVEDVDGNWFLDCAAGIATNSTGHSHPDVVKAITEQAQRYLHMSGTDFYYDLQVTLAEALERIVPINGATKSFFGNSGAEANEAALKLSRYHSKRSFVIAFFGSFHGRTMGALGLTASKAVQRAGFGPTTTPGVFHAPYPDPYRHPRGPEAAVDECFEYLEDRLFAQLVPPDEVAAIVVEPIQGEGGYIMPPASFFQRLQELARQHGILIVADEVQSGMGRTGRMFACEHVGLEPDMVTMAKGIASGMPLGVATGRAALWDWTPGAHASTFGGNPVSCAAALATIRLLENGLIDNAVRVGQYLLDGLRGLQEKHLLIGDVRGRGLMIGVELVRDRQTKERAIEERDQVVQEVFKRGVLLLGAGRNVIRFSPPLLLTTDHADTALAALDEALGVVGRVRGQVATARS